MKTFEGKLVSKNIKIGIVAARFNEFITSKLLSGAMDGVYLTSSAPHLLELVDARAGKGAAVRALCGLLGIDPAQVAAFGNADNDADLLRLAGFGVAVADASPACLAAADEVCGRCEHDGVAAVLRRIADAKRA